MPPKKAIVNLITKNNMKKLIIFLVITLPTCIFAQLKVDSLGNVGIGVSSPLVSKFSVGNSGTLGVDVVFSGNQNVLKLSSTYPKLAFGQTTTLEVLNSSDQPTITQGVQVGATTTATSGTVIGLSSYALNGSFDDGKVFGLYSYLPSYGLKGAGIYT